MSRAGVTMVDRVTIEAAAMTAAVANGADPVELVAYHVAGALERLHAKGGDVLGLCAVTIGAHPDFPGGVTIEAKAGGVRPDFTPPEDPDPGCPIDHSLDEDDEG